MPGVNQNQVNDWLSIACSLLNGNVLNKVLLAKLILQDLTLKHLKL